MNTLLQTLSDLIRINSVNAFYESGPGEAELACYVETFFRKIDIPTERQEVFSATKSCEPRFNVIARIPGRDASRCVVLEAHMDTVSVQGMEISPFDPRFHNGLVYGRGACDTKAGLAAMMHAMAAIHLANEIPACNVWLAAVVDEEYSFRGVLKLCETLRADAAIIAEPTDLRIAVASKGVLRWRIIARGRAAHSSKCDLGVNAIYHMAQVIRSIEAEHMRLGEIVHPLLGPASCNVGKISGGVQVNFVPAECTIEIDRRLLPGEDVDQVMRGFQTLIDDLKQSIPEMDVVMESPMLVDSAWTVDQQTAVVSTAREVSRFLAMESDPVGVPFGSDASKFGRRGIPCIIFGPGSIDQAHAATEFVQFNQVEKSFEFYRQFLLNYPSS